jgi:hypothetical protein
VRSRTETGGDKTRAAHFRLIFCNARTSSGVIFFVMMRLCFIPATLIELFPMPVIIESFLNDLKLGFDREKRKLISSVTLLILSTSLCIYAIILQILILRARVLIPYSFIFRRPSIK